MLFQKSEQILGTEIHILVSGKDFSAQKVTEQCFEECRRIEQEYSRFIEGNQLANLNASLGKWMPVSDELFTILQWGKKLENQTQGKFSLSVKSILESWGYNAEYDLAHETEEGKTGSFEMDEKEQKILLSAPIEIGALGKGYALDRMKKILSDFPNIFVNAGGDIYARGEHEGKKWMAFFDHPSKENMVIGEGKVDDFFLATSSPKIRKWRDRHHLVDAQKKEPANDLLTTYVQAKEGIIADGYATVLFVVGYEKAKKFILQEQLSALIIGKNGDIFCSPSFMGKMYVA